MAPVEIDSDKRMSGRKNLCIVFLHSEHREFQPEECAARSGPTIQIANAANRSNELTKSAGKCGQIYGGPIANAGPSQVYLMIAPGT
jgi:hypothetical protein